MATLFVSNDNDVYLQGYILAAGNVPVTNALPSFTVYINIGTQDDPIQGSAITALTGVSMSPVTGTPGDYRGLIPGTAGLTADSWYFVIVTFGNYHDQFDGWFQASNRTNS